MSNNRTLAYLCLAVCAAATGVWAGEVNGQQVIQSPHQAPTRGPAAEVTRADFDFPGGTVADYVAAVEKAFGAANAAVQPGAEGVSVASVKLVGVTRSEALRAITVLCDHPLPRRVQLSEQGGTLFHIVIYDPTGGVPDTDIRVWRIDPFVAEGSSRKDILKHALFAIGQALELAGGEADLRYHEETGLLIVRGQVIQLHAVDQVVDQLNEGWTDHRDRADARSFWERSQQQAAAKTAELEKQLQGAQAEINALREELARLRRDGAGSSR